MTEGKSRILIIDDESTIRNLLNLSLSNQGYSVLEADGGRVGLERAVEFHPHLVILDLGLPDIPGLEVLRSLRKWTTVPVIVLTVSDDEATKVALLDGGADDYLTKPFGTPELLARIRVCLRHHNSAEATPVFRSGELEIDINRRQVKVGELQVRLTAIEFDLLGMLVRHQGRVVPQAQLLTEVWGKNASEQTHYLRIYIGQLRKKLESDSAHPKHIMTEPGIGYRIV